MIKGFKEIYDSKHHYQLPIGNSGPKLGKSEKSGFFRGSFFKFYFFFIFLLVI